MKAAVEEEYEEILDILMTAIEKNYDERGDAFNDALDIVELKTGGYETEFEKHMRKKSQAEERRLKEIQE